MRQVEVKAIVANLAPSDIYPIICDFNRYPEQSEAVRSVVMLEENDKRSLSSWEVNFRQGILRWVEEDRFYPDTTTIEFEQTEGDAEHFAGKWVISPTEAGSQIDFIAAFDMGIPSLSELIEPIAEQALKENIKSILLGLIPSPIEFCDMLEPTLEY